MELRCNSAIFCVEPQFRSGALEMRFAMISGSWIRRLGAPLVALILMIGASVSPVQAADDARKVGVVAFGLFGDQGVFRNEATGAAQVVAGRFETGPVDARHNFKGGGRAA